MRTIDVLIPYRPSPEREPLFDWCRRFWEARGFPVLVGDSPIEPFTRGYAINALADQSGADVLIIADADTVVTADVLAAAVTMGPRNWCIAYSRMAYFSLSPLFTRMLLEADPADELPVPNAFQIAQITDNAVSGCLVVPHEAFAVIHGFDRRFRGWGSEDFAFLTALDTLWSQHYRLEGAAYHLHHPHVESERFEQPHFRENEALCHRYEALRFRQKEMAALIVEQYADAR